MKSRNIFSYSILISEKIDIIIINDEIDELLIQAFDKFSVKEIAPGNYCISVRFFTRKFWDVVLLIGAKSWSP